MTLEQAVKEITPPDQKAMEAARGHLDSMAKPLHGLGLLEDTIVKLAGIEQTADVDISKKCVVVMCADNGIVSQGVTQTGQEVTAIVTENLSTGDTTVCHMSHIAGFDVLPVDIGVAQDLKGGRILKRKVSYGTGDFTKGPAMTREQARQAIETGIAIALERKEKGYKLLATGEMGIGNTTTSAAIAAVLLSLPPEDVTGRGSGLTSEGLQRKINVIKQGIALNQPQKSDPVDVIAKVGGYDIAGLCGLYLGGAAAKMPVMVDGVISAVAALCAVRLCPEAINYILPSHMSAEPAGKLIMQALGLEPILFAHMALGEGTGAVAAAAVLDLAMEVYRKMCTFEDTNIEAYVPLT